MADVQLSGLSISQFTSLQQSYQDFIAETTRSSNVNGIECSAYRLVHSPALSPHELTIDGQYAPRKRRTSEGIELTGANFEARIELGPLQAKGWIGTSEEQELPRMGVMENFLRVFAAHRALQQGGVLLHSAGLVFDGKAYIFSGRSNAGKTTLTRKAYESGAWVLSDDINLLLPSVNGYKAHAVPFTGEFGRTLQHRGEQDSYPVAGIILLEQGDQLKVESSRLSDAVAKLLTGSPFVNTDADESTALLDIVTTLVTRVPVVSMQSRRDDGIDEIMNLVKNKIDNLPDY